MVSVFQQKIYKFVLYTSYVLYALSILSIYTKAPEYLTTLNVLLKIYVSLFLIVRFNPFVKIAFTEFDRQIVFSAGIFLALTTTITQYLQQSIASTLNHSVIPMIKNNVKNTIDVINTGKLLHHKL
jgi:hypothetical protein